MSLPTRLELSLALGNGVIRNIDDPVAGRLGRSSAGAAYCLELQDVYRLWSPLNWYQGGGGPCLEVDSSAYGGGTSDSSSTEPSAGLNRDGGLPTSFWVSCEGGEGRLANLRSWGDVNPAVAVTIWLGHEGVGRFWCLRSGSCSGARAVRCLVPHLVNDTDQGIREYTPSGQS